MVQLPSSIVMLPKLERLTVQECEGLQLSKQDEGGEQVRSTMSSNMEHFILYDCNIPDEFLLNVLLTCFANVKNLNLSYSNFTVLPACIKECHFLKELALDFCENLQEIRGVPLNIKTFSTRNCRSLASLSRSMLLNEKVHREVGDKTFIFPGTRIPNWFEHYSRGEPISFWFRNKFPAISLCFATELLMNRYGKLVPKLIVNVNKEFIIDNVYYFSHLTSEDDLMFIFDKKKFKDVDEVLLENEWNHVVVSYKIKVFYVIMRKPFMERTVDFGVHIFKQKSSTENIRFTDPWEKVIKHVDTMDSHIQFMLQQQNLAVLEPHVEQGREWLSLLQLPATKSLNDNVNCDPNSTASTRISSSTSVQGCKIASRKRKIYTLRLDLDNEVNEPFCHAPSKVVLYSDSTTSRLASDGAGSNKEWKPKPTNTVNQGSGPASASAPSVSADVTGQLQSASSALDSEEATSKLQRKLEDFHHPQRQHVILPNHIYVPDSEKKKFSFGSLGVSFGVNTSYVSGPESEKSSTPLSETSQTVEETVEEQASSCQNATVASEVRDYLDHPQSRTNVPWNLSSSEVDGLSSAIQEYNESKSINHLIQLVIMPSFTAQVLIVMVVSLPSARVTTKYSGNVTVLPAPNSQSPQEGVVLSTAGPAPLVTQAAELMQSSIAVIQQPVPVFRPPSGVHISHYPPNYIPYGHYFSPFYVPPPAIHQFLGNGAFPQQPQANTV